MDVIFEMFFLILGNVQVNFNNQEFSWGLYIILQVLPNTMWFELVRKKEFIVIALNLDDETFVVHIVPIVNLDPIHRSK